MSAELHLSRAHPPNGQSIVPMPCPSRSDGFVKGANAPDTSRSQEAFDPQGVPKWKRLLLSPS